MSECQKIKIDWSKIKKHFKDRSMKQGSASGATLEKDSDFAKETHIKNEIEEYNFKNEEEANKENSNSTISGVQA